MSEKSEVTWQEVRDSFRRLQATLDVIEAQLSPEKASAFEVFEKMFRKEKSQ